jgi:adhesin/invasin
MKRHSNRPAFSAFRSLALLVAVSSVLVAAGCERAFQVAPTSSVLALTAPSTSVALNSSIGLTVTLTDSTGAAVTDSTTVSLSSSLGNISPAEVRITNGRATATLQAGNIPGTATITATSGSVSKTLAIRVGSLPDHLLLSSSVSGGTATIVAYVFDAAGVAMPGTTVTFTTTAGTLATSSVTTNSLGQATNTLYGTSDAVVTATVDSVSSSVAVQFGATGTISVNLTFSPAAPTRNQTVTFTAAATSTTGGALYVDHYEWTFSDGLVLTTTGNTTSRAFAYEGIYAVTVRAVTTSGGSGLTYMQFAVD